MNWYKILKYSQVWSSPVGATFGQELQRLHELEYKYNRMLKSEWKGYPQRRENILKQLAIQLNNSISIVKPIIIQTFKTWLDNHAINDPTLWSQKRQQNFDSMEEYESPKENLYNTLEEFMSYTVRNQFLNREGGNPQGRWHSWNSSPNWGQALEKVFSEVSKNPKAFPSLKELAEIATIDRKENMFSEARGNLDSFNASYNTNFNTLEEAIKYIDSLTADSVGMSEMDILSYYDVETLVLVLEGNGLLKDFIFEINKNLVFPLWFSYWKKQKSPSGHNIVQTRKNIEKIYKMLIDSNKLSDTMIAITMALNIMHQNGNLVSDYVENYSGKNDEYGYFDDFGRRTLDKIHKQDTSEWDKELRDIGVVF